MEYLTVYTAVFLAIGLRGFQQKVIAANRYPFMGFVGGLIYVMEGSAILLVTAGGMISVFFGSLGAGSGIMVFVYLYNRFFSKIRSSAMTHQQPATEEQLALAQVRDPFTYESIGFQLLQKSHVYKTVKIVFREDAIAPESASEAFLKIKDYVKVNLPGTNLRVFMLTTTSNRLVGGIFKYIPSTPVVLADGYIEAVLTKDLVKILSNQGFIFETD